MKELLFSVTKKDFEVQTFVGQGPGGQHRNKTQSGVRIIHKESKATGQSCDTRSQHKNKELALKRLLETDKWKLWHNKKCYEAINEINLEKEIEKDVEKAMEPKNLKIEVKKNRKWIEQQIEIDDIKTEIFGDSLEAPC